MMLPVLGGISGSKSATWSMVVMVLLLVLDKIGSLRGIIVFR